MIINSNSLRMPLRDKSVQCVVTSPPYWGLRDYGQEGQLGLEPTPELYIANMVQVFREVYRVLRDDGTLWLNIGDTMWGGKGKSSQAWSTNNLDRNTLQKAQHQISDKDETRPQDRRHETIKPKDMVGIPWALAFALRSDGWYLRSEIIWSKKNPMPESVTDRPTKSHEQVFLLTKKPKYFYDADAIREQMTPEKIRKNQKEIERQNKIRKNGGISFSDKNVHHKCTRKNEYEFNNTGRNKRTVWEIATQSFPDSHFATFPEKLVVPCIKAGSSEKGCCAECGAAWERVVEKTGGTIGKSWHDHSNDKEMGQMQGTYRRLGGYVADTEHQKYKVKTIGWRPTCEHKGELVPCVVFDPFGGSGTVKDVAERLGRRAVVTDLKFEYCQMAKKRCERLPELEF